MKRFLIKALALCLMLSFISPALAQAPRQDTALHHQLQEQIDQIAKKWNAVGVSAAYVRDGSVLDTFAYGYATRKSEIMTADTNVRTASVTKVMVGLAVHLSAENGVMALDGSVDDYLGFRIRLRHSEDCVTVRSILTHTSSIDVLAQRPRSYEKIKEHLTGKSGVLAVKSGEMDHWVYNNYAFYVLGIAVERANGKTMDQIMDEAIENKLDVDASFWAGDLKDTQNVATIYNSGREVTKSKASQISVHSTGIGDYGNVFTGGYYASAYDLGKIVAMLAADGCYEGERIISEGVVSALEEYEKQLVPGEKFYQAQPLRFRENMYGRDGLYYHTGSSNGEYNMIIYDPVTRDGVVVLSTGAYGRDEYDIYAVCGDIARLLLNTAWE